MPLNDYRCPSCDTLTEDWKHLASEVPAEIPCGECGKSAKKVFPLPTVHFTEYQYDPESGLTLPVHKGDCWAGTPLEGNDLFSKNINPDTYKSTKTFIGI